MADAYTEFLNLTKPEVGASRDTWGDKYNGNFQALDTWAKATDAAVKAAADVAGKALPKAGGDLAGPLKITQPDRQIFLRTAADSKGGWAINSFSDGVLYFQSTKPDLSYLDTIASIGMDGRLWTKSIGDVGAAITAAANAGTNALAKAIRNDNAGRQDIPGTLAVTNYFDIVRGNVLRARLLVDGAGTTILQNGDNSDNFFYVTTAGAVWTKQFGDLNSRIEQRASDYANTVANSRVHSARFVYAGDLNMNWSPGGMNSPYGGYACVVDRWTYDPWGNGLYIDYAKRFRYLQLITNNAGWFTVGAAS